jgi:hypothetical protein
MLLEGTPIFYQGNPLQDFTLTAFLDRFSFRNPKQKEREKGGMYIALSSCAVSSRTYTLTQSSSLT